MAERVWDRFLTEADRTHVEESGHTEKGFGNRPAVLLIDLYRWVFGDKREPLMDAIKRWPGSCGPTAWDSIPHIQALLESARETGIPVVHVTGLPDQIALNAVAAGTWLRLHPKWNCMAPFIEGSSRFSNLKSLSVEQRQAGASPCILHFEGAWQRTKPWQYRCVHPHQWLYLHYRSLTPFPLQQLEGRTLKNRIAKRIPLRLMNFLMRFR